ncbi:MAG: hypothetical protein OXE83_08860 [Gammaproteobacteria bacterium]|nr:hypothetical protein [Gammaproteobacteria bacterium]
MLFSDRGSSQDGTNLLVFVAQYYEDIGVDGVIDIDGAKLASAIRLMYEDFPYPGGADNASPFKKISQFVCYFVALKPIGTPLPDWALGDLGSHDPVARSNAVVALAIAIKSLEGATLKWHNGESRTVTLANRISLSRHSFVDIADALTNISPVTAFKLVSVLFEQMAYKTNPDCQYPID